MGAVFDTIYNRMVSDRHTVSHVQLGIGAFSDMKDEEFGQHYLGHRSTSNLMLRSTALLQNRSQGCLAPA